MIPILLLVLLILHPAAAAGEVLRMDATTPPERIYIGQTAVFQAPEPVFRVAVGNGKIATARALSDRQLLIQGLSIGQTQLLLWHAGREDYPQIVEIKVEIDPRLIAEALALVRRLVPTAAVEIIAAHQEVLLEGTVASLADMHRVLQIVTPFFAAQMEESKGKDEPQHLSMEDEETADKQVSQVQQNLNINLAVRNNLVVVTGPQQVQLEVTIAEVSRSGIKKMGLGALHNHHSVIGVFPTGEASGSIVAQGSSQDEIDSFTGSLMDSTASLATPFGAAFQLLFHDIGHDTMGILSLLKGQGLAKFLATPTLVAMSGQRASFRVGGEFPVPTTGSDGNTEIAYREYGILLKFTPTVIDAETIHLQVAPEVSSPDWSLGTSSGGVEVPGVKTRTGYTTLQLKDGQSFAMAGLLKEEISSTVSKLPLLGDIPLLGTLFTSKQYQKDETELVVIVIPRLVRPLNPGERRPTPLEAPTGGLEDGAFFFLNRTEPPGLAGSRDPVAPAQGAELVGPAGFSR